jgi:excinuclease ABC subunit C
MKLERTARFDPDSNPPSVLELLPSCPAVFVLLPDGTKHPDALPYISHTRNLRRRLTRLLGRSGPPSRLLNLRDLVQEVHYQLVGSAFEAQWLLYRLSRHYDPSHYRDRLRLRPPALLKINLRNRFPRCYFTRRLVPDGSLYYGPFPSRAEADRFASAFLDLFKIRRCVEDLNPDPSHPGCIYSQMRMCLAPCFAGCSDKEYRQELGGAIEFLETEGGSLIRALEAERDIACRELAFERAAEIHKRLEAVRQVLGLRPGLVRQLWRLHAVMIQRAAQPKTVLFFRVRAGEICGPAALALEPKVSTPVSLDQQLCTLLDSLQPESPRQATNGHIGQLPPWEHLSLLARWYYSSFREGELVMLPDNQELPHARLIRICRKLVSSVLPVGQK